MRVRLALFLMFVAVCGVVAFMLIFVLELRRADDSALAIRLSVIAQDVRETIEARARIGLKLRYMSDLQAMIERERAASPGLAVITVRSESGFVLFSTDRVTVGDQATRRLSSSGWTEVGASFVTVGLPVLNSFAEQLGGVEVGALRSGLDLVHMEPLVRMLGVATFFLLLASALAWLGSAVLLHPLQCAVQAARIDAGRALMLIHEPRLPSRLSESLACPGPLMMASHELLELLRDANEDIARLDEAEG